MSEGIAYLAGAYSATSDAIMQLNYKLHRDTLERLLEEGEIVYSPIVNFHYMARECGMPTDAAFWSRYDMAMLEKCNKLYVINSLGAKNSIGTRAEIERADELKIPIWLHDPQAPSSIQMEADEILNGALK